MHQRLSGVKRGGTQAFTAVLFVIAAGTAHAQNAMGSVDAVIRLGLQTLQLLDQGKASEVWDQSSPVMKTAMSKETLGAYSRQVAQALGGVRLRDWSTADLIRVPEGVANTPPGLYLNVGYIVQGNGGALLDEVVSFRREPDNTWRVTGYVPRQKK